MEDQFNYTHMRVVPTVIVLILLGIISGLIIGYNFGYVHGQLNKFIPANKNYIYNSSPPQLLNPHTIKIYPEPTSSSEVITL